VKDKTQAAVYLSMRAEPVFSLTFSHPRFSQDVHYAVESEKHGVYEMRFKRLQS
jgi:hypothetical protein